MGARKAILKGNKRSDGIAAPLKSSHSSLPSHPVHMLASCARSVRSTAHTGAGSGVKGPNASSRLALHRKFALKADKGPKQKLVVLGTGWGSFRTLRSLDYNKYEVTVVSPRNHFLFTPLLASTTTGVLEFRSIMETIRSANHEFDFVQAQARSIDFDKQVVMCSEWLDGNTKFELKYDKLVIGVGADCNTFGIPGVEGNVHFLKELSDARGVRNHIVQLLEEASIPGISTEERKRLLNFVVVGGGPTGVEFAAELSDFFWSDVLKYYPNIQIQELKITLVEAGDTILSAFSSTVAEQAMKNIKRQGIDMKLHTKVKEVQPNKIILDDGSSIPCGMIVWSTGVGPRKLLRELGANVELERGRLVVDEYLRLKGHPNAFAIGDCATIQGNPLPPTAQVAHQQGLYLAKHLNDTLPLDKKTHLKQAFQYYPLGLMAYVGSYKSVFDTQFFKGTGWLEFLAWRSVYLTRLGSWKNKMMVPYNWLKTLIWGRDVSFF